jgi:uroporphyrinogen-III synthase
MAEQEKKGLAGLRVLSLESRRAQEMAKLIANYGGEAIVAPSMREIPIAANTQAIEFARSLAAGEFDAVIFLTGVGTRALSRVVETVYALADFVSALSRVTVVARGPKPVAVLREMGVPVALTAPEPNTWRELLSVIDENCSSFSVQGKRVAVQEYGKASQELLEGLRERGALVTQVPVYQWALPEDTAPLREAAARIVRGEVDVALFTTSVQVVHLLAIARDMGQEEAVRKRLQRVAIGSIGPVTSQELREEGIAPDFEPEHPKMGFLVNEAARRTADLLTAKRKTT